ncbi:MAG: HAD-IA family hydrolase [Gammaproteobacteria bacterium]|nr:HAD-IA family hydrolase [Gammaproteobacteria bacterium]NIM72085.1 HAD-IA family hydrolase [Gammaproteobacteria bacterium]NIN38366.1 HAD-IA family hydrolase [Gammaproteobacteria bacterium]NIO23812.1 HAD-IA family hydrolase [Gammaproteobacteria bacterium]NIO64454.1 HAD-IA family hydrolase [Gammaproteobacteria bacterium]
MRWQLIIFDCDGVLVDSEPISNRIMAEVLAERGLPIGIEDCYEHFMGRTMDDCLHILRSSFGHAADQDFVESVRRRTLEALREEVRPIPGIVAALERIAVPVCVASSGQLVKMRTTLERAGLLARFEGRLFSAAAVARGKPHPDVFLHAAETLGADPAACAVVEDTPVGVEAGIAAGMTVYGYAALSDPARLTAAGARVFADMRRLPELLGPGAPP